MGYINFYPQKDKSNPQDASEEDKDIMNALMDACMKLKNETMFDDLAAALLMESLAEIAEADHKIEKTEVQLLKNLGDVFGVKSPRI